MDFEGLASALGYKIRPMRLICRQLQPIKRVSFRQNKLGLTLMAKLQLYEPPERQIKPVKAQNEPSSEAQNHHFAKFHPSFYLPYLWVRISPLGEGENEANCIKSNKELENKNGCHTVKQ